VLYGLIRLGHQTFYSRFGLSPDDVGLGYGEALARAAGFTAYLLAVILGLALLAFLMEGGERPQGRYLYGLVVGGLLALLVFSIFSVLSDARAAADKVEKGKAVRPAFMLDYGIRAEPARITWHDDAPAGLRELRSHGLMMLGNSAGTVVVYDDVDDKRTLRIPANAITVSVLRD
jgi:hypothetical protein